MVFVGWIDFDGVAANAKSTTTQILAALVLNVHETAEKGFAGSLVPLFEHDEHAVIGFGRAEPVNATDRGDDDDIAAFEEGTCGTHAQFVELIVDGGFFLDVNIRGGDVSLRLIKIVVADEIFDGVFRKEVFEFVIELCGERFVVRENDGWAIGSFDDARHGKGFAGAGYAEKHLVLFAAIHAAGKLLDGGRLVAARLIRASEFEIQGTLLQHARRHAPKRIL